ncbi:MAG TPA: alpha/beta hydrolase [Baekduia sp.]|nr:alpha/beta hydrolase [Baekduia sp.]
MLDRNRHAAVPPAEPPSLTPGTLPRQEVELPSGRVAYLRHGSGPPLLLIHGIPTSARLWEPLLGDLGEHFDCIVPDLLGLGRSMPAAHAELSSPGQAAMFAQLLDALGVGDVLLALHDQGGAHGQQFLKLHGERVRAVAFCGVVCFDNWPVPIISLLMRTVAFGGLTRLLARTGALEAGLHAFPLPRTVTRKDGTLEALSDDWMHALRTGGPALEAFSRYVAAQDVRWTLDAVPTLEAWTKPATVIWAADDVYLPPTWGARLAATVASADDRVTLLPHAGHFWQAEVPRTGARHLLEFFGAV